MTADLSNWRESPHSEWAFRNVDKVLSTDTIKAGSKASSLDNAPNPLDGFNIQLSSGQALDLTSYLNHTDTDGFLILHKGKIIYERYAQGNDASSKHILMSMTKSITSLITGILAFQGKIDVTAPIKHYVPEASSIFDNVTVQHCLDMQTGIKYNDANHEFRAAVGWNPLNGSEKATNLHAFLSQVEAETVAPGAFNYSSVNTDLLGWALERATGKKLAELISEFLWQPMGAESDALVTVDSEGSARAAGGLCATVRDVARIGQLLADGGRDIVPQTYIDDILQHGDNDAFSKNDHWAPMFQDYSTPAYHNCFVSDPGTKTLCALGIHGQQMMVDLQNGIVMARTGSSPISIDGAKTVASVKAFREIRRILLG